MYIFHSNIKDKWIETFIQPSNSIRESWRQKRRRVNEFNVLWLKEDKRSKNIPWIFEHFLLGYFGWNSCHNRNFFFRFSFTFRFYYECFYEESERHFKTDMFLILIHSVIQYSLSFKTHLSYHLYQKMKLCHLLSIKYCICFDKSSQYLYP